MKSIFAALALSITTGHGTSLGLFTVKMPIYLHGSDMDIAIRIMDVPFTSASDTNSAIFSAISLPFIPPNGSSWVKPTDANLASRYGIHASLEESGAQNAPHWIIIIDASTAKLPEGYPFSIEQVADAVVTCVKMMAPKEPDDVRKVTVKLVMPKK